MLDNLFDGLEVEADCLCCGMLPIYDVNPKNITYYLNENKKVESQKGKSRIRVPYFILKAGPKTIPSIHHIRKNSKLTKNLISSINAKVEQLIQKLKDKAKTNKGRIIIPISFGNIQSGEEPDTMELECRIGIFFMPII